LLSFKKFHLTIKMECPICLEDLENKFVTTTPCGHKFCLQCIFTMLEPICPMCRANIEKQMPLKLLKIIQQNAKLEPKKKSQSGVNVQSLIDFPPL